MIKKSRGLKEMQLSTKRLLLRPVEAGDAEEIFEYARDESVTMMLWYPMRTREEVENFLKKAVDDWNSPVPVLREFVVLYEGKIAGGLDLEFTENGRTAEIGWLIGSRYRGLGLATEAARALKAYAFEAMGADRLIAECDTRNQASENVMKKLGMHFVLERERIYPRTGVQAREYLYEIRKDEVHE